MQSFKKTHSMHLIASHRITSNRIAPLPTLSSFSCIEQDVRVVSAAGEPCYKCLATRCGGHNAHDLCDPFEAAAWLQSVLADLQATLVDRRRADEHVLARYVGALTVPAQYLYLIYVRVSANECAARLADPLLIERTYNLMHFTLEPFAVLLRALLEPLAARAATPTPSI